VPEIVEQIINQRWSESAPWKFRWLTNRNNKPIAECYDQTDGIAASLAGAFKMNLIKV
jgi:hypothetical protein